MTFESSATISTIPPTTPAAKTAQPSRPEALRRSAAARAKPPLTAPNPLLSSPPDWAAALRSVSDSAKGTTGGGPNLHLDDGNLGHIDAPPRAGFAHMGPGRAFFVP